ncbi:MAG: magnesium transporter [Pseudomonadota bacterium]
MQESDAHRHILSSISEDLDSTFEHLSNLLEEADSTQAFTALSEMHYADLADFLDHSSHKIHQKVLSLLGSAFKAETLIWLSPSTMDSIEELLTPIEIAKLVESLDTEDAIEVLEDFSEEIKAQILTYLPKEKSLHIVEGFTYADHTAGRVMEKNFASFQEHWTAGQAIDYIRQLNGKLQDFHAAIVVDTRQRPVGSLLLCDLLKHQSDDHIKDIMNNDLRIADTSADLDQLSYIFKRYALTIVPIVNKAGKIVGTMSINNMLYIVEQQVEEEFMSLGGVHIKDTFHSLFHTAKHRFLWLFVNLITACITALIISRFSATISEIISIAAIMPIVASMGGNAGTQAMTVTVIALANKEINSMNMVQVVLKELLVCGLNGFVLACIGGAVTFVIFSDIGLSTIFGLAVIINFLVAGFFGSFIPIILDHMNLDPAAASSVFLTALTDAFGFFVFLILAYYFLV